MLDFTDVAKTRKLTMMRERYSNLTEEEGKKRMQKAKENRAKRKNGTQSSQQSDNPSKNGSKRKRGDQISHQSDIINTTRRRRINWLLKAVSIAYETGSKDVYNNQI
ncbi:hypothetical protein LIER_15245 [Lithospermum erythrorhizon]|uniref:Uncharacterized protein n=1 Tax=Lithospermum erythrorhizon TaxID=34254 RepID=A0AAV3Q4F0_LITER